MAPLFKLLEKKYKSIYTPNYIDDITLVVIGRIEKLNIIELEKAVKSVFK